MGLSQGDRWLSQWVWEAKEGDRWLSQGDGWLSQRDGS